MKGASRGIGRATALALADEGFDIAAAAWRDAERFEVLIADIEKLGPRCRVFDLEIGERSGHEPCLDAVARECEDVHFLVSGGDSRAFHRSAATALKDSRDAGIGIRAFASKTAAVF